MTMKLVQKSFLKGTREFEIIDDAVYVRMKGWLTEQKLTVGLSMLNPEPVVNGSELEFHGRARHEAMLSLFLDNPNAGEFNAFVDVLRQKILSGGDIFTEIETVSSETLRVEALSRNVYEEPPDFDEPDQTRERISFQPVNAARLDDDITMLKTYLREDEIRTLLDCLETLKAQPQNEAALQKVVDAFNDLGIFQGAVLTYASYLKVLLPQYIKFT